MIWSYLVLLWGWLHVCVRVRGYLFVRESELQKETAKHHCCRGYKLIGKYLLHFITLKLSPGTCMHTVEAQIDSSLMLCNLANFLWVIRILIMSFIYFWCEAPATEEDFWSVRVVVKTGRLLSFVMLLFLLCSSLLTLKGDVGGGWGGITSKTFLWHYL